MKQRLTLATLIAILLAALISTAVIFSNNKDKNIITELGDVISNKEDFPDIETFRTNPANYFIIKSEDYNKIESAQPFLGKNSACPHTGGHINFTKQNAPYETEIISPVDGVIDRVNPCFDLGTHDKFDISVKFASYKGDTVGLDYSIEPFDGLRCKNDPDYYKKYIKVENGQKVKAGEVIAIMPKFSSNPNSGTHVHFNLSTNGKMVCPNIFDENIENEFNKMIGNFACPGEDTFALKTFCLKPEEGEDIVNR